ncbi:MAG: MBL fold metallo-hydrolase [Pseudomonadota bacterium]|nr:MBL fold metallo-hydrolase [Pseudomonadota bacterium]
MSVINPDIGTRVDKIADRIYRISTPVPPSDALPPGFTFNQFLIAADQPLLYHTGPRQMFAATCAAVASVIPLESLRYVGFSHVEADECGALNDFLAVAPQARPLCSDIAAMVSVADIADREPVGLGDGQQLELGSHCVTWTATPHLPHSWECGHLFENRTRTLFCGDLFTQFGAVHPAITTDDILEPSEQARSAMDYYSHTAGCDALMTKLAALQPRVLACMHGASWRGDGAALLGRLANRLSGRVRAAA